MATAKIGCFIEGPPKLTVSKYEGGARPLRAAAPAFLLRLLAATSRAALGGKGYRVESYHALRVYIRTRAVNLFYRGSYGSLRNELSAVSKVPLLVKSQRYLAGWFGCTVADKVTATTSPLIQVCSPQRQ